MTIITVIMHIHRTILLGDKKGKQINRIKLFQIYTKFGPLDHSPLKHVSVTCQFLMFVPQYCSFVIKNSFVETTKGNGQQRYSGNHTFDSLAKHGSFLRPT